MSEPCFSCQEGTLTAQPLDYEHPFGGCALVFRVEGLRCDRCGEEFFSEHVVKAVEREAPCIVLTERAATSRVVRDVRSQLGVTQLELARLLDLSNATLSRYENGAEAVPRTVALALLALCLRSRLGEALEGPLTIQNPRLVRG